MKTLAERLAWAMKCAGLDPHKSQSELARLVGEPCKAQNIQNILSGSQRTSKYTPRIAQVLGCDGVWLAEGTGKAPTKRKHNPSNFDASGISQETRQFDESLEAKAHTIGQTKPLGFGELGPAQRVGRRQVPLISYVQAGMMTEAMDPFSLGDGFETILTDEECSEQSFALRIKGRSMLPRFEPGDTIVIDPQRQPRPGDFVVAKNTDEEATFKKYKAIGVNEYGDAIFELIPLNEDFATLHSERDHLRIVGVAIEHRKPLLE